jgi:hypothetical protein
LCAMFIVRKCEWLCWCAPLKISFASVKEYVLDPYIGDQYISTVEVKPDFDDWRGLVVARVEESLPPLVSYALPAGSHIGAVVETNEREFSVHDPGVGSLVVKSIADLRQIRRHDVLLIRPS